MHIAFGRSRLVLLVVALFLAEAIAQGNVIDERGTLKRGDEYQIEVKAGDLVELSLKSKEFDAYLHVISPQGEVYENDDEPDNDSLDSKLIFVAEETGIYTVVASTADGVGNGAYRLTGKKHTTHVLLSKAGELAAGDERSWKGGEYIDRYEIDVKKGQTLYIAARSNVIDAYISVHTPGGIVTSGDDPPAVILNDCKPGKHTIIVTSFEAGEVGGYELEVRALGPPPNKLSKVQAVEDLIFNR